MLRVKDQAKSGYKLASSPGPPSFQCYMQKVKEGLVSEISQVALNTGIVVY